MKWAYEMGAYKIGVWKLKVPFKPSCEMQIQNILQVLTFTLKLCFCDLVTQNRLGNHRWLIKHNRGVQRTPDTFSFSLFAEMAKSETGRKSLRNFMKRMKPKKINKAGRHIRRL